MPEEQNPLTFGELKALLGELLDRGGDQEMSDTLRGHAINAAEQWITGEVGAAAFWLESSGTITVTGGETTVTLDREVADVVSIRDEGNLRPLSYIDRQRWNDYIVNAEDTVGTPLVWTKFGYTRRTNRESPSQGYGQMQLSFFPVPSADTTLQADLKLQAGSMVDDDDMPVMPIRYHYGLIEAAAFHAGAYDVGSKAFQQHERLAQMWLRTIKRDAIRNMGGSFTFIPLHEHTKLRPAAVISPPTRIAQLRR